jgi:hypothetical protein
MDQKAAMFPKRRKRRRMNIMKVLSYSPKKILNLVRVRSVRGHKTVHLREALSLVRALGFYLPP